MTRELQHARQEIVQLLPRLRRFARTLARNTHDADDLVQITLERALTRLDQWQPGTQLSSWMFTIMKNAWIDEVRSRGRGSHVFAPEEAGVTVGETPIDAQIELLSVQAALEQLPDEQRLAVSLVLVEGLSYKEAAEVMQCPMGTLTSRLARGRDALSALLSDTVEAVS